MCTFTRFGNVFVHKILLTFGNVLGKSTNQPIALFILFVIYCPLFTDNCTWLSYRSKRSLNALQYFYIWHTVTIKIGSKCSVGNSKKKTKLKSTRNPGIWYSQLRNDNNCNNIVDNDDYLNNNTVRSLSFVFVLYLTSNEF